MSRHTCCVKATLLWQLYNSAFDVYESDSGVYALEIPHKAN